MLRMYGRPRYSPSSTIQMIGRAAARVPSRNCSPPALMPETIALVRSCGDIGTSPLWMCMPGLASDFAGDAGDFLGRADDFHCRTEIGEVTAQAPARLPACLFGTKASSELDRTVMGRFAQSQRQLLTRRGPQIQAHDTAGRQRGFRL